MSSTHQDRPSPSSQAAEAVVKNIRFHDRVARTRGRSQHFREAYWPQYPTPAGPSEASPEAADIARQSS